MGPARAGTVLGRANRILRRHGYALGPDPASTDIATVGGADRQQLGRDALRHDLGLVPTVRSMTLVLASGTVIDTAAPDAEERFAAAEPELARGLLELRDELRADAELAERVRRKFQIKNTMGYRLCAFLDADTPLEIFRRLVVGSEGRWPSWPRRSSRRGRSPPKPPSPGCTSARWRRPSSPCRGWSPPAPARSS